ncbi:hypothetical protein FA13DRAFT_1721885 [Coprinellus micaceus]|uniref:CxC2-like cysteine cluster KDZ transposase-associated domain-containing protein n=1 Tax=Coprinellus micaceus TaxID=71717 RepID=A0A4Y7RV67_COPMI|nr:hypothetical protein FA13DRAFT_1721885 [Coprinellus micaceus]
MAPGSRQQFDPRPSWKIKDYGVQLQGRKRKRNGLVPVAVQQARSSCTLPELQEASPSRSAEAPQNFPSSASRQSFPSGASVQGQGGPRFMHPSHPSGAKPMENPPQRPPMPTTSKPEAFLPFDGKTSKGKTSHDYMREWLDQYCHPFLQAILRQDRPPTSCENCGSSHESLWRLPTAAIPFTGLSCTRTTSGAARSSGRSRDELEDMCIRFNGILSEPPDLKNDFSNGHLPGECDLGRGRVVTFVHTNGFHYLPVFPCSCERALEEPLQHIESGYYPATFKHVSTVFTFRLLQHFHLHRVDAHMASESYCSILSRLTNYTFPFLSPSVGLTSNPTQDRKRELSRVWQQFNYLEALRQFGFGFHAGSDPPRPAQGDLALWCAVCPQPGVNLPKDWIFQADPWRFWRYLVADGNFVLNHLLRYSREQGIPTCNAHRAIANRNKSKKGYDCTGIMASACARHGCFAPGSVCDMQLGEKQAHGDYSLCQAAKTTRASETPGVLFAYDVNCQFCVNFRSRVLKGRYLDFPSNLALVFLIGLFHVHGHKEECLPRFALPFAPVEGELAETAFKMLNEEVHESDRAKWSAMMDAANITRAEDVKSMDVYCVEQNSVECRKVAEERLGMEETKIPTPPGTTAWLASGIQLQEAQFDLKCLEASYSGAWTDDAKNDVAAKTEALIARIESWNEEGDKLFPSLDLAQVKLEAVSDSECVCQGQVCQCKRDIPNPEEGDVYATLPLPSSTDLPPKEWDHLKSIEEKLREAQATEILEALREEVGFKSCLYRENRQFTEEKRERTRMYDAINKVDRTIRYHSKRYIQCRWAMGRLGMLAKYPQFEVLTRDHVRPVTAVFQPNARGQRNLSLSWIWTYRTKGGKGTKVYLQELYRVSWIRAISRRDRWREETKLLTSEMSWFVRYCLYQRDECAKWEPRSDSLGAEAFSRGRRDMWRRMAVFGALEFSKRCGIDVDHLRVLCTRYVHIVAFNKYGGSINECTTGAFAPHLCVEERICGQICSEAPPSLAVVVLPRRRRPSSLLNPILLGAMEGSHPVIEQTSRIVAMSRWGDSGTKVCLLTRSPPLPTHPYDPPHWFPRPRLARLDLYILYSQYTGFQEHLSGSSQVREASAGPE